MTMAAQFRRTGETARPRLAFTLDGASAEGLEGDSVLVAILAAAAKLRENEFDRRPRAGFCLMGACQDCWVWTADGAQIRACSTSLRAGMALLTGEPQWTRTP